MQNLVDELMAVSQKGSEQNLATSANADGTMASIRANTTIAPATQSSAECWLDAKPMVRRCSASGMEAGLNASHEIAQLTKTVLSTAQSSYSSDLDALCAIKLQIAQISALRKQLDSSAPGLGRVWKTACAAERRALMAKERLNLMCDGSKQPVAEAIIVYLTKLKNSHPQISQTAQSPQTPRTPPNAHQNYWEHHNEHHNEHHIEHHIEYHNAHRNAHSSEYHREPQNKHHMEHHREHHRSSCEATY